MCEWCQYSKIDFVREIIARARPDQIRRLLEDIRNTRPGDGPLGAE